MSVDLQALLKAAPGLDRAVEAEPDGSVLSLIGNLDGESTAAVVVLAENDLTELSALLGLGEVTAWSASGDLTSVYVVHAPESFVAVLGPASKAPGRILERLVGLAQS